MGFGTLGSAGRGRTRALDPLKFDHIGDSRTADLNVGAVEANGLSGTHWFNWANALSGNRMRLGRVLGVSGNRTDQYINANLSAALASNSGWLVFGFPAVNDLSQSTAGYTDSNGVVVTSSNVASVAAGNIIAAALQALGQNKNVILTAEPGSTSLTATNVQQKHEFNLRLRAFAEATPGVFFWSANSVLLNPTGSATLDTFRTNVLRSGDQTHYSVSGGKDAGAVFASFINDQIPYSDIGTHSLTDALTTNPRQLIQNALFSTLTGGTTNGTIVLSSGTVPSGWKLSAAATTSVTITSASNANGFGNDVTMAFTASAADTVTFESNAPSTSAWNLTDVFEGGIECDVAASPSNAAVYWNTQIATDAGTNNSWALYPVSLGPYPTSAYSVRLLSKPMGVKSGSTTKSYISPRAQINFSAAGSITVTFRRPDTTRRFTYSNGVFSG